jgi:hypothetical protein
MKKKIKCESEKKKYKDERDAVEEFLNECNTNLEACYSNPCPHRGAVDDLSGIIQQKDERIRELHQERKEYQTKWRN